MLRSEAVAVAALIEKSGALVADLSAVGVLVALAVILLVVAARLEKL